MKFAGFSWAPTSSFTPESKLEEQNDQTDEGVLSFLNSLNLKVPGEILDDEPLGGSVNNLTFGEHAVAEIKQTDTSIKGVVSGATLNVPLRLRSRHIIEGVTVNTFREYESSPLVSVGASAVVVFRNCVFERSRGNATQKWVDVGNGGKAIFVGCMFLSKTVSASGTVISNAGAAANVQVVGCYNGTGIAFAGVTSAALGNL